MFINAMGLILADDSSIQMRELTKPRALAAVPFAGRYRIIDFMLSSMVNSGVISVGVLTSHKYKSLMDHLGNGAAWDLSRKNKGLYILPPYVSTETYSSTGDVDGLSGVLDFFRMSTVKYVIVAGSNVIFNTTFNDIVAVHEESGADISILYNHDTPGIDENSLILDIDKYGFISNLYRNPVRPVSDKLSLNVFIISRELLIELIMQAISKGERELTPEALFRRSDKLRMRGYEFKDTCLRINSVQSYFGATMKLLRGETRKALFMNEKRIFTKVKDEAPSLYSEDCEVADSMISDGCRIYGKVFESMLFRSVTISKNASVRNCILMQNVHIAEGCELENVIIDKNTILRPGIKLVGQPNYPVLIGKGAVV